MSMNLALGPVAQLTDRYRRGVGAPDDIIKESLRVDLVIFDESTRPHHRLPDGRQVLGGEPLSSFVARIGGWTGTVRDPWGGEHAVSVEDLADLDPDRTFVQLGFRYVPVGRPVASAADRERMANAPVAYMEAFAVEEGDPYWAEPDEEGRLQGRTLREMREELGGDVGFLVNGKGNRHKVSLLAWRHADPDRTRIIVRSIIDSAPDSST
jgi:hypothetical protein